MVGVGKPDIIEKQSTDYRKIYYVKRDYLVCNDVLMKNEYLTHPKGYRLVMQDDDNLVTYERLNVVSENEVSMENPVWASQTFKELGKIQKDFIR